MIELKNLTKIYSTKGGSETKALDDVSLSFGETGLVFLLGKSGSGKSTLLNIIGGLDEPTGGEVVVMGKSLRDFSDSDFDSYRNTYVGFVFQEYNMLNEFSVEENIALALELQGNTHDKEKIRQILDEVELGNLAKHNPNTLSGGQKQRVAIARAIVKDPQIIMADEPTGALDSETGKQVFDTLKRLSKTRLVLVVTHEREFAEQYGDRLVELKDGKVISDVTKVIEESTPSDESLTRRGENVLTIRKGKPDEDTLRAIEKFIEESEEDVIISRGEADNATSKSANRIGNNGVCERFEATDEKKLDIKKYDGEKTNFLRSRLPARKAIKIGASSLKLKPFRLVLTILLSVISLIVFGLFSTMLLYDGNSVLIKSFMSSDYEYVSINKQYKVVTQYSGEEPSDIYRSALFTPMEVTEIGGKDAFGTYSVNLNGFRNVNFNLERSKYYIPIVSNIGSLPKGHALRNPDKITGNYPTKIYDVCISSYLLECLKLADYYPVYENEEMSSTIKPIRSASDIIGERLVTEVGSFKVVGVFDSGDIPAKYDEFKVPTAQSNDLLYWEYMSYINGGLHSLVLADESLIVLIEALQNGMHEDNVQYFDYCNNNFGIYSKYDNSEMLYNANSVRVYENNSETPQLPINRFDNSTASLEDNQIIPSVQLVYEYFTDYYNNEILGQEPQPDAYADEETYKADWAKWNEIYQEAKRLYDEFDRACNNLLYGGYIDPETDELHEATNEELQDSIQTILDYVKSPFTVTLVKGNYDNDINTVLGEFEIVGFYYNPSVYNQYENGCYCSQSFYDSANVYSNDYEHSETTKYEPEDGAIFGHIFVPVVKSEDALNNLFGKLNVLNPDTDVIYCIENPLYTAVSYVNDLAEKLSMAFLIAGIVLSVFAILLLFNFISMSISNKSKEIGILRALGARSIDVFKIFFAESGIIVGICTVLAVFGSFALTYVVNTVLKGVAGVDVVLFVFNPISVVMIIAIAVLVLVLSTFLPVYFVAKKKPVDSIRSL